MAIVINGTSGITFPDSSTQSAASAPVTDLYAIGSYVTGRPQNFTTYSPNSTLSGSSLYSCSTNAYWRYDNNWVGVAAGATVNLVNTGTWRCLSIAWASNTDFGNPGLWVRIS